MRRWRRRWNRIQVLRPQLATLYRRDMKPVDVVDCSLSIVESIVRGDYRLAAGKKAPPPFEGAQA